MRRQRQPIAFASSGSSVKHGQREHPRARACQRGNDLPHSTVGDQQDEQRQPEDQAN